MTSTGSGIGLTRDVEVRPVHWVLAALVLVTAGIHVALGVLADRAPFVILGVGFLAGLLVFFTRYFRPVLYLLGAGYVVLLTAVWVLAGTPFLAVGLIDKVVQAALFGLFVYLFFLEQPAAER